MRPSEGLTLCNIYARFSQMGNCIYMCTVCAPEARSARCVEGGWTAASKPRDAPKRARALQRGAPGGTSRGALLPRTGLALLRSGPTSCQGGRYPYICVVRTPLPRRSKGDIAHGAVLPRDCTYSTEQPRRINAGRSPGTPRLNREKSDPERVAWRGSRG